MSKALSWREKLGNRYPYCIVAACIINMFLPCAMILSCIGIFIPPVTSYFQVAKADFSLSFALLCIAMMVSLPITGKLVERFSLRRLLPFCIILCGCGFGAMGFAQAIWHFYICGIVIGLGMPLIVFLSVPTLIGNWFKERMGFFIGLCMAFTGIGGAVFNSLGTALIQTSPEGWRLTYLVFAVAILAISLPVSILCIFDTPEEIGLLPYGSDKEISDTQQSQLNDDNPAVEHEVHTNNISAKDALAMSEFYALALFAGIITLNQTIYQFFASYALSFSSVLPAIAAASGLIASAAMAGQAIGKILLGIINDKSIRAATLLGIASGVIGLALMWAFPMYLGLMLLGSFLFGFVYAMTTVQTPLLVRTVFGQKDYALIYSRVSIVSSLLSALAAVIWSFIIDSVGGYPLMFTLGFICMGACLVLAFFSLRKIKRN